jgi:hypothetical protein
MRPVGGSAGGKTSASEPVQALRGWAVEGRFSPAVADSVFGILRPRTLCRSLLNLGRKLLLDARTDHLRGREIGIGARRVAVLPFGYAASVERIRKPRLKGERRVEIFNRPAEFAPPEAHQSATAESECISWIELYHRSPQARGRDLPFRARHCRDF